MKCCIKNIVLVFTVFISERGFAQTIVKSFTSEYFSTGDYKMMMESVGKHKIIPAEYEKPILLALCYFPELAEIEIEFRIRHVTTPLASRPSWTSIFKNK